jgi:hypothetical protein
MESVRSRDIRILTGLTRQTNCQRVTNRPQKPETRASAGLDGANLKT